MVNASGRDLLRNAGPEFPNFSFFLQGTTLCVYRCSISRNELVGRDKYQSGMI